MTAARGYVFFPAGDDADPFIIMLEAEPLPELTVPTREREPKPGVGALTVRRYRRARIWDSHHTEREWVVYLETP